MNSNKQASPIITLPWKNSLLTKKEPIEQQNPVDFFSAIIHDSDTFNNLFDTITTLRNKGKLLEFQPPILAKLEPLKAFVIVQDPRGVHWICPLQIHDDPISAILMPLDQEDSSTVPYIEYKKMFGHITISPVSFASACSRGFENASSLLLGEGAAQMSPNHTLVAAFNFTAVG